MGKILVLIFEPGGDCDARTWDFSNPTVFPSGTNTCKRGVSVWRLCARLAPRYKAYKVYLSQEDLSQEDLITWVQILLDAKSATFNRAFAPTRYVCMCLSQMGTCHSRVRKIPFSDITGWWMKMFDIQFYLLSVLIIRWLECFNR